MGTTIQEEVRQGLEAWYDALPQDAITAAENALQQVNAEEKSGACILPNREDIFRAFQLTPPETSCQGLFNQIHEKATKKVPEADFSS